MEPAADEAAPYHERQTMMRCGVHALNNALQRAAFTASELDGIADELSRSSGEKRFLGLSAYRAPMGLGQYNVSVLEVAAARAGRELRWHDRRKPVSAPLAEDVEAVLVNRSSLLSRHWFAVRAVGGAWYNLDSKLAQPERLASQAAAVALLNAQLAAGAELLYIVRIAAPATASTPAPEVAGSHE